MNNPRSLNPQDRRPAPGREPRLHLLLDLDQIQEAWAADPEDLCRLDNVRLAFPGIVATVHTRLPYREALGTLDPLGLRRPDHLLGDFGAELYHRREGGDLVPDLDYRNGLASRGAAGWPGAGATAAGVRYLERVWATPRPLVVTGREDRDFALLRLADLGLVRPGRAAPAGGFPVAQATWLFLGAPGLSETLRILLAFLASLQSRPARVATARAAFQPPAGTRARRPGRDGQATANLGWPG